MPLIVGGAVLLLGAALVLGVWPGLPGHSARIVHVDYTYSDQVLYEPLTGFAYRAEDTDRLELGMSLVYIDVTWAEWEPQEGVFDIAGLEERNNIPFWKEHGLHAVLRFVCDLPGDEPHRDIPLWLYERTGDGEDYAISYGKGYAPDYENPAFIEAHQKALAALGEYFSQDTFVSYVELGSLGHWGEWHVKTGEGLPPMPGQRTCQTYVEQYVESFPGARLLTRRPYAIAVDRGLGVYNDMTGHEHDTLEWLDWQKQGGEYSHAGRTIPYRPVEAIWKTAPVGGEFTSAIPMEDMLGSQLETTLSLLEQSHMTFIGPKAPTKELTMPGADEVLKRLGYRYWISSAELRSRPNRDSVTLELTWENSGAAPLYFDWPVTLYVYAPAGELTYSCPVNIDLTTLSGGSRTVSVTTLPRDLLPPSGFSLGLAISDPMTNTPSVRLAMDVPCENGIHNLGTFSAQ